MFIVYLRAPIHQVTDSDYSLLLSHSLVFERSFALNRHFFFPLDPTVYSGIAPGADLPSQLIRVGDNVYYWFPVGSSILSAPFVALAHPFGLSPVRPDGRYYRRGEVRLEARIAAVLMGLWCWLVYETARLWVPIRWAVLIALVGGLGTQAMSTTSRSLWSDTWALVLLQTALLLVVRDERSGHPPRAFVLATLLAWLYIVRPTHSLSGLAVLGLLLVLRRRRLFVETALFAAAWLLAFVVFSHHYYLSILPPYYRASRLTFSSFGTALLGNLISLARGLLVYVPVTIFVAAALLHGWRRINDKPLAVIAAATAVVYWLATSGYSPWWGGHSYGARLMSGVLPWLAMLSAQGVAGLLAATAVGGRVRRHARVLFLAGAVTAAASVLINIHGAFFVRAWLWNLFPVDVAQDPDRVWDWRDPQFLAALKGSREAPR
jgi:hypothetical protein